jgi:acyl dehydratase
VVDIEPGAAVPPWRVPAVDAEKMKLMAALLRDPNPIHFDADAVRALGLGDRPINQGPTSMAYVANMLVAWVGDPRAVRRLTVRFLANVLAGEAVTAGGRVTGVREEAGERLADCDVWLDVDGGRRVLAGRATVLLPPAVDHQSTVW